MSDPRFATSLAHGLALLDAFADRPLGLNNKQLAERTGLSKASITRLSLALTARGLLMFDADSGRYRLGSSALTLGYPLLASLGLRRLARLPMTQLADAVGGTVSLAMHDRRRMVYVETCRGHLRLGFRPDVGAALPILTTAAGRAWLAGASASERQEVLEALRRHEPVQHATWTPALAQAMRDLDRSGFCLSPGHWQPDVHAVAVPLGVRLNGERLVLNCGLPTRGLDSAELAMRVGPRLVTLARRIERDWRAEPAGTPAPVPGSAARPAPSADARPRAGDAAAQTLAHGLDLLACFQPREDVLGNAALARRLGLSPQTVVRLTHTLACLGLLKRDAPRTGYRLGAGTVAIAYPMLNGLRLRSLARPAMLALSQRLGAAVSLGLRHQLGMVYVETAWRTDGRLLPPDTGAVMPMLATAIGRAWLCSATPSERTSVLNQIRVLDPEAAARHAGTIDRAMAQFARHGHCSSRDFRPEIEAVAVPFPQPVDGIRFVMNCGVLASRPLAARRIHELGSALSEVVQALSATLER